MKKVLALDGSMRKSGNTSILLNHFIDGAKKNTRSIQNIIAKDIHLEYCRGCLRCNLIGRCSISGDSWETISKQILDADILAFATPIYFHHITAPLKKVIDRFRSFVHVQITESGLLHTPVQEWNKDFVLFLCMGSSDLSDATPVIELFQFLTSVLGPKNRLHVIAAKRLAVINQILKTPEELKELYEKMLLPLHLVDEDYLRNREILSQCHNLGMTLTKEE